MDSCYIIPTERPPTLRELKHALLTYDKVYLASPDDRELIPPSHFMAASAPGRLFPIGVNVGAVRPLGKVPGYDDDYAQALEACSAALEQESLVVLDPPGQPHQGVFIGNVPLPPGWPNPTSVYHVYRSMASLTEFIGSISRGLDDLAFQSTEGLSVLAPDGADDHQMEVMINGQRMPSLPMPVAYPGVVSSEEQLNLYTRICLARLGSVVKSFFRCRDKGLIPFTADNGVASTVQLVSRNCASALSQASEAAGQEEDYLRRLRIFDRLVVSKYIPADALDEASVSQILRCRTSAWGREGDAREKLSHTIKELSLNSKSDEEFERQCEESIHEYRQAQADLQSELAQLRIRLECVVGMGLCAVPTAIELARKVFLLSDLSSLLIVGGVFFKVLKDHGPEIQRVVDANRNSKDLAGYALLRTYWPFAKR